MVWINNRFGKTWKKQALYPRCPPTPWDQNRSFLKEAEMTEGELEVGTSLPGDWTEGRGEGGSWPDPRCGAGVWNCREPHGLSGCQPSLEGSRTPCFGETAKRLSTVRDPDDPNWCRRLSDARELSAVQDRLKLWATELSSVLKRGWECVRENPSPGTWVRLASSETEK